VRDQFLIAARDTSLTWIRGSDGASGQVELPSGVRAARKLLPSGKNLFLVRTDAASGEEVWSMPLACVTDHTPPQLQCPERVVAKTKSRDGAAVSYPPATATDDQSTELEVTYDVPSESVFPVGITTVTATTRDEAGQEASCSFEVEVQREGESCDCSTSDTSTPWWAALLLLVPFVSRRRGGAPG
jgi:MYXO-CTERM domain-containing protein